LPIPPAGPKAAPRPTTKLATRPIDDVQKTPARKVSLQETEILPPGRSTSLMQQGEIIPDGAIISEGEVYTDGEYFQEGPVFDQGFTGHYEGAMTGAPGAYGSGCDSCGGCGPRGGCGLFNGNGPLSGCGSCGQCGGCLLAPFRYVGWLLFGGEQGYGAGCCEGSNPLTGYGCVSGNCASGSCASGSCGSDCTSCGDALEGDGCDAWITPDTRDVSSGYRCSDCARGWHWAQDLSLFVGPHGFKGPLDNGNNGNFGYHYGINWAFPFWHRFGIGAQVGGQIAHSNFSGNQINGTTDDVRTQYFVTAGFFRRSWDPNWGWQCGLVADWLNDTYVQDVTVTQLRGEVSRIFGDHELGFLGMFGTDNDTINPNQNAKAIMVTHQYLAFYRYRGTNGNQYRFWGGVSGAGDGIVGGDTTLFLSPRWGMNTQFNYLFPQEGNTTTGLLQEAWNVEFNLVWYPGRTGLRAGHSRYRPLFNVANNGSFLTNRAQ